MRARTSEKRLPKNVHIDARRAATNTHEKHKLCKIYLIKIHLLPRSEGASGRMINARRENQSKSLPVAEERPKMFNNRNPQSTPRTQMQDSGHVSLHTPHFINFPRRTAAEHLQLQL